MSGFVHEYVKPAFYAAMVLAGVCAAVSGFNTLAESPDLMNDTDALVFGGGSLLSGVFTVIASMMIGGKVK